MNSSVHLAEVEEVLRLVNVSLTDTELLATSVNNIVYYAAMLPVAICGNIFTLLAVIMTQRIRSCTPNLLIGVLACNDIMAVLTCHLISVASMANGGYVGGQHVCNFQSMMAFTYFKLGFLTKCCISLDRFIALAFPLNYKHLVTQKRVYAIIVHNVIFSFATSALTLIMDPEYIFKQPTWYICINDFQFRTTYKTLVVILEGIVFFIGFIIFIVSNVTIIRVMLKLNRRSKRMYSVGSVENMYRCRSSSGLDSCMTSSKDTIRNGNADVKSKHNDSKSGKVALASNSDGACGDENTKCNRQKKELQFAKLVTIIVTVFVILWIPYMAVIYWEYNNERLINVIAKDIAIKLVFANCCFSPILYGLFNANFRKAYIYYIQMLAFYFSCKISKRPSGKDTPWYKKRVHTYVTNVMVNGKLTPVQKVLSHFNDSSTSDS